MVEWAAALRLPWCAVHRGDVQPPGRTVQRRQGQRMIPPSSFKFAASIGVVYNLPSVPGLVLSRKWPLK